MEFVAGRTAKTWLTSAPPTARVLSVLAAAGRGLQAAHTAGIVHRGFKPSNVLIGEDGRVAVTDFGLAGEFTAKTRTATGIRGRGEASPTPESITGLVGTAAHMAPEHARNGHATLQSDQYSYCVAVYEALVGVRPGAAP